MWDTNFIPPNSMVTLVAAIVNCSLKRSLETRNVKKNFQNELIQIFCHQRVCWHHNCHSNFGSETTGNAYEKGGGLKGSGLHLAKKGCDIKHPPLLLQGQTWSLLKADSYRRRDSVQWLQVSFLFDRPPCLLILRVTVRESRSGIIGSKLSKTERERPEGRNTGLVYRGTGWDKLWQSRTPKASLHKMTTVTSVIKMSG